MSKQYFPSDSPAGDQVGNRHGADASQRVFVRKEGVVKLRESVVGATGSRKAYGRSPG